MAASASASSSSSFPLRPVGVVRQGAGGSSRIEILQEYREGLQGMEDCPTAWIFLRSPEPAVASADQRRGAFATPMAQRVVGGTSGGWPNGLIVANVRVTSYDAASGSFEVEGLEARDGSLVCDIKADHP